MKHSDGRDNPIHLDSIGFHLNQAQQNKDLIREINTGKESGVHSERVEAIAECSMSMFGISKDEAIDNMLANAKADLKENTDAASRLSDWLFGK